MQSQWLLLLIFCVIFVSKNVVFSLGENEDFYELLNMVEATISAAESYSIPEDNFDMLKINDFSIIDLGYYDFIVVGAGSAGAVIANRLSEISKWKVLLLEAGGSDNDFTKILGLNLYTLHSDFNWGYNTTVQKNACLGLQNRRCFFPQGKVIGGGSTINAGVYSRGDPEDYDRWEYVYGNTGWSYEDILPYFLKSENAVFFPRDIDYHGVGGYFTVNYTTETPGLDPVIINGFSELGLPFVDYNGRFQKGISKAQFALRANERVNTASAFLDNFSDRPNLKVSLNSFVTKILIDKKNVAYGVQFVKDGQKYLARARREVIVSAGAINSAQLLMLSGIGPKKHLQELGIPDKKDLPVGQNFQDHVMFIGFIFRANKILYNYTLAEQLILYVNHKRPLTAGIATEMLGFTNFPQDENRRSDIEFIFSVPAPSSDQAKFSFALNDEYTAAYKTNSATDILAVIGLLHPKSRGSVTLKSSSPIEKPNVDPNYLAEEEDIEKMYQAIEFLIALNNSQAFKEYGVEMVVFDYPNCGIFEKLSKDWWICGIKHLSTTIYHPTSTNSMGPDPNTSVVDPSLKVHGVKKLRVADTSIMPELISGHTMAPAIMIGEKVADIIKAEYCHLRYSIKDRLLQTNKLIAKGWENTQTTKFDAPLEY